MRILRTCRDLGVATVAVYSDADRGALHVRFADEAYRLGPAPARESYLRIGAIVEIAVRSGAEAVHPGYGFLSENPAFAQACAAAGIAFVGPPAEAMRALGEKTAARRLARDAGVTAVPGMVEATRDARQLARVASEVGYPIVLKAAAGGGGKGLRIVSSPAELEAAFRGASGEAESAFGDASLYLEKRIEQPRHVEMQILADARGRVVWLGERDCSIQRRLQKVVEESPGPTVDDELRGRLGDAAVRLASAAGYVNAGTVEFLVDASGASYFLEVNARLQVEHPVTEAITGLDLVALQLAIASGERLPFAQADVTRRGHAIECRVSAEDPERDFLPATGTVTVLREPAGPGVRVDSSLYPGMVVPTEYDPLLAKVIASGRDRPEAVARMRRALREMVVAGVRTTLPFLQATLDEPDFVAGRYDTGYVAAHRARAAVAADGALPAAAAAILTSRRAPAAPPQAATSAWRRAARDDVVDREPRER